MGGFRVGGGLNYVTGPMGAGKSLYGVRRIVDAITHARYCVTNVRLHDDAFDRIAFRCNPFSGKSARNRYADLYRSYYVFQEDLAEAMRYRIRGAGESRAIFVWDETHNDLNNRDWKKDGREEILRWATQLRKLGFVGYLLSQHQDNTDAALRRVSNFQIRMQNQRESKRAAMGLRVPIPLFLAAWFIANVPLTTKTTPVHVERFVLGYHKKLYDTWGLYHGLAGDEDDDGLIWLGAKGAPRAAGASAPATEPTEVAG